MIDIENLTGELVDGIKSIYFSYIDKKDRARELKALFPDMSYNDRVSLCGKCKEHFSWDLLQMLIEDHSIPLDFTPLENEEIQWYKDKYYVSSLGRVFSKTVKGFNQLDPKVNSDGYIYTNCTINGKSGKIFIHRAVAELYIPNPEGYDQVDHIDTDKNNYQISNLRWVDGKGNMANLTTRHNLLEGRKKGMETVALRNVLDELLDNYPYEDLIMELTQQYKKRKNGKD